jgi:hypothetical protein
METSWVCYNHRDQFTLVATVDIALIIRFLVDKGNGCSSSQALYSLDPLSRQRIEQVHEARLVRITDGGFAIWLDPFGMLNPQVVVNLLPELGVGVDLVRHGRWLDGTFQCGLGRLV